MTPSSGVRTVTVVVPTYRRPDGLRRALAGLAISEDPGVPWDVVVVDNHGSIDHLDLPPALRHRTSLVHESAPGAAAARNRGIRETTGDVVAFLDDDVVPDSAWLRALVGGFDSEDVVGVGGRVVLNRAVVRPPWFIDDVFGPLLADFDLGPAPRVLARGDFLLSANLAVRKGALIEMGGFDTRLGPHPGRPGANDDVDLCQRLLAAGRNLWFLPNAVVTHELPLARLRRRYIVRRYYEQGRADWLLQADRHRRMRGRGVGSALRIARGAPVKARRTARRGGAVVLAAEVAYAIGFTREALRRAGRDV